MAAKTIDEAIYDMVKASTAITKTATVHYVDAKPGTAMPYVTISKVSDPHPGISYLEELGGEARIQVSLFTEDKYSGADLSHTIRRELQNYQGTQSGKSITWMRVSGDHVLFDEDHGYHFINDFLVEYVDST